jgi:hypothetical protein
MITALDWIRVDLGAAEIKAGRPTDPCANHVQRRPCVRVILSLAYMVKVVIKQSFDLISTGYLLLVLACCGGNSQQLLFYYQHTSSFFW